MAAPPRPAWRGPLAYLLITFSLAWLPALLLHRGLGGLPAAWRGDLLAASALYVLTMGWQPLLAAWAVRRWVDPADPLDQGLRQAEPRALFWAALSPLGLACAATLVALALAHPAAAELSRPALAAPPGAGKLVRALLALASAAAVLLIWVQAFSEEVGWRGYFLSRLMQRFGAWRGLLLHGLAWGLWYAPVLLLAGGVSPADAPLALAAFTLTSALLGALLGWVRLATRSVLPAVVANAVLTLTAGLPLLLNGADVGLRGAVYGPAGWLPMGLVLLAIALGKGRRWVAAPGSDAPGAGALRRWLSLEERPGRGTLH